AKLAAGGAIEALKSVIQGVVNQSFALVRPPGHHATRENASGLCIFNNIVVAINYLRNELQFKKKIAIIDIDCHFGDGIAQFFYEDPSILYFSIHEYDFMEGEKGFMGELGESEGLGTNINFPVPFGLTDVDFLDCLAILPPILTQFQPELIVVACGFDFHFSDSIGNGFLTSFSYYNFARLMREIADEVCRGKICFILEGGYSIAALPFCVQAVIDALLDEKYVRPPFEFHDFSPFSKREEITKISSILRQNLKPFWSLD
ncbi:MAG: histone deacetylase family protein, partial [Promethearchaeota archaeon]